jgi:hypothetical protein
MLDSAALEGHMYISLKELMRIALLLAAIDAAVVLFPVTAQADPGFGRASYADAAGANSVIVLVTIDKSSQRMTVSVNGEERYEWPISTGRPGYSTPSGTYTATSMNEIWYSKQWDNSPMPHSVFFIKDGHAIHGTLEVKNLGRAVSHGCVRLAPKNAAILYALVAENGLQHTQVVVTGATPGGEYGEYNEAEEETSPGEYRAARGQTNPRRVYVGRSASVPYYNGSQGYYRNYYGSRGYYGNSGSQGNGSPFPWFFPHW